MRRSKVIFMAIALSFLVFSIRPGVVRADSWDEYSDFMQKNFYYLNAKKVHSVSCRVQVSSLDDTMKKVRSSLKSIETSIRIFENLSDFRVQWSSESGVTIFYRQLKRR